MTHAALSATHRHHHRPGLDERHADGLALPARIRVVDYSRGNVSLRAKIAFVARVFLSHSSRDSRQAVAVKQWLIAQEPGLVDEIYLHLDPHTGIRPGKRWKTALSRASNRCEAVICLLSKHWL